MAKGKELTSRLLEEAEVEKCRLTDQRLALEKDIQEIDKVIEGLKTLVEEFGSPTSPHNLSLSLQQPDEEYPILKQLSVKKAIMYVIRHTARTRNEICKTMIQYGHNDSNDTLFPNVQQTISRLKKEGLVEEVGSGKLRLTGTGVLHLRKVLAKLSS